MVYEGGLCMILEGAVLGALVYRWSPSLLCPYVFELHCADPGGIIIGGGA